MDNKLKILYKNNKGIELDSFLNRNRALLANKRIFYVIKANLDDKEVYKIGISERGANAATARLLDYVYNYGVSEDDNKCKGVKLYLLLGNRYNPNVTEAQSAVRKLETKAKAYLKDYRERGHERFSIKINDLLNYLIDEELIEEDDEIPIARKTPRVAEREEGARDSVKAITGHTVDRRGQLKFIVEFLKYKEGGKLVSQPNRKLTYDELVELRDGKGLVDAYVKANGLGEKEKPAPPRPPRARRQK